ncbi:eCIS core domain-containing protein [Bradyrhizobium sp. McL0616]|uniref:eCIS core domain-containing protein n=1 Tax=Bradyrhizobium sp. McL0616 TaxID=3415674 RepID=UPI003CEFEBB4
MFAPPVVKPKTKSIELRRATLEAQRPGRSVVNQAQLLQHTICNLAPPGLLAKRANVPGARENEDDGTRVTGREAALSWDFSKIPVFSPGHLGRTQMPSPFPAPRLPIQAKLVVGRTNDPLEREADRVADQVLARPAHPDVSSAPPPIQRNMGQEAGQVGTVPAGVESGFAGPGQPLDPTLQQDMGQRFGHDFSGVRVHTGAAAEQSARDVRARAYTVGHRMVFGAGQFAPRNHEGRRLIAHELTHVVQQSSAFTASLAVMQRDSDKDLTDDRVRDLKEYVSTHPSPYQHVIEVIRFSKAQELDDNVSADFIESQSLAQLEKFASTEAGREMLDVLYDAMMTGHVTAYEKLQADKILFAKWKSSPAEIYKIAQLRDPDVPENLAVMYARKRADALNEYVASKRYRDVVKTVRQDSSIEDDIASRFIALQSPDRLETFAASDAGRAMLDVLYEALITGDVTGFERLQADRILLAKAKTALPPTAADVTKAISDPAIFPLATGWDSTATIHAELLPNGKVKVFYDSSTGLRSPEFTRERSSLYQRYGESAVFNGITLEPDEPVIIRLFDKGGSTVTVPAIRLIDFFNQQKEDTLGKIKAVSVMGATVGLGGIGAGGILGWADTIAFAINAGTLFISANRDVIARTALGRRFLEAWDVAEGIVEYYNWGRLGMDGLRLIHATVSPPFKLWRQEVAAGLTSVERETIANAQQQTEAWLDAVKKAESTEAAKARPSGSQSKTGYSRTAPTTEEEIASAAGRTRRRVGAIDRGKGARQRYANDPVKPKVPGAPTHAVSPITSIPGHSAKEVFSDYPAIKHVFEGDVEGGFHSKARGSKARAKEVKVLKRPGAPGVDKTYQIRVEIADAAGGKVTFIDAEGRVRETKDSTMFPDHLTEEQVLDEVYAVMLQHKAEPLPAANAEGKIIIEGVSPRGFHIRIVAVTKEAAITGEKGPTATLKTFYPKK